MVKTNALYFCATVTVVCVIGCSPVPNVPAFSPPTPTPPAASPSPTASPVSTPTPTAPPPNVLSVQPNDVQIDGTGASNAQSILVQETGYAGVFTESDTCHPGSGQLATITPSSGTGPSVAFTATGVAAGICTVTFSDANGQQASATITVTTTGFGVQ